MADTSLTSGCQGDACHGRATALTASARHSGITVRYGLATADHAMRVLRAGGTRSGLWSHACRPLGIYGSPSAAAVGVAKTKSGKPGAALDGWIYWPAKRPGSTDWANVSDLRKATV